MQNRAHYAIGIYTRDHTMYAGHAAYTGPIYTNKLFYCTSHAVYTSNTSTISEYTYAGQGRYYRYLSNVIANKFGYRAR